MDAMVHIVDHPIAQATLTQMRDENTSPDEFRRLLTRLSTVLAIEATRHLPMTTCEVRTPLAATEAPTYADVPVTLVPILRAGLGMLEPFLALLPQASIGPIGLERDETTKVASEYYLKLPHNFSRSEIFVIDPMLATGGSSVDAITRLRDKGARAITLVNIIAAPEGIRAVQNAYPDVPIYVAAIDEGLNDDAYIVPGLGDAGDRYFNTL